MDKNIKSMNLEQMVEVISFSKRVKNPLDIKKIFNISLLNIHFILQNQKGILERWRQRADLNGIAKESSANINLNPQKLRKYQKSCSTIKEENSKHKVNDACITMEHQKTAILNESNEDVILVEMPIKCIDITNEDTAAYKNIVKIKKEPSSVRKEETNYTSLMDFPQLNTIKLEFERENTKRSNIKSWEYIEDGTNIRPVQIKHEIEDEIDEFEEFLDISDEQKINSELEFMEDDETEYIEIYKIVDTEYEDDEGLDNIDNANDLHTTEIEKSLIKNKLNINSCPQIKLEQNVDKLLDTPSKQNNTTTNTPVVEEEDDNELIELVYEIEESDEDVINEVMEIINKHKNTKPESCANENHYGNQQEIKQEPLDEDAAKEEEEEEEPLDEDAAKEEDEKEEEEEEEVITVLEIVSDDETVDYDKQDEESDLIKQKEVIEKSKHQRNQVHKDIHGTNRKICLPPKRKSNVNDNIPSTSRSSRNTTVPTSSPPNKMARLSFNLSEDLITSSIKSNKEAFKCVNYVLEYFQRQNDLEAVKKLHKLQLCFSDRN